MNCCLCILKGLIFFYGRNDIDRVKGPYANKKASDAFLIKMVDDLPQQSTK